ncbi:MAG: ABC transporter substrate-binding protein, partial [Cyanobacteria bacterium P01_A01_bin.83]
MKRFIEQFFSGERSSSQEKHFADSKMALTLVSLSLGVLLTSCQGENSVNSKEGLKLGVLAPITGDLASIGRNLPTAVQLAVDAINECGGVNEAEVTLITEDSQTDPRAGSEAMTELIEDEGVAGVVGAFTNSVSKAALDIAVDKQVMMISPGSTSSEFTEGAKNHEFDGFWARTAPSDIYQSQALATLARNQGFNEVATVVINNGYGIDFETEFVTDFKQAGGNVVGKAIRYDPQAASLANEAKAIFQGKPDAVLAVLYGQTGSSLLKSAFEEGYINDVTFLLTDRVYSENFIEQVGKTDQGKSLIAGALGIVPRANGQGLDQFQALWNQKTGEEITAYVPHNW